MNLNKTRCHPSLYASNPDGSYSYLGNCNIHGNRKSGYLIHICPALIRRTPEAIFQLRFPASFSRHNYKRHLTILHQNHKIHTGIQEKVLYMAFIPESRITCT